MTVNDQKLNGPSGVLSGAVEREAAGGRSDFWDDSLWLALLTLPALACLRGGFVWTDGGEILDGNLIAPSWRELLTETARGIPGAYYRPLVHWLHSITVWLFGADPLVFRLTNFLLHAANVLLGYALARAVSVPRMTAIAAFALFAVHPLVATPISWAGDRTDSMALLGATACLLCWVRFLKTGRRLAAAGSGVALLLGLMAKETAACAVVVASVTLFNADMRRRALSSWLALVAVAGGWFAWRAWLNTDDVLEARILSWPARLATGVQIHLDYALQLLLPNELRVCDSTVIPEHPLLFIGIGLVATALVSWVAWRWSHRQRMWQLLALVWLIAFLIPTSGLFSLKHIRADRYLYSALPAVLLLVVGALSALPSRKLRMMLVAGCYLYFGIGIVQRAATWGSDETLWAKEVQLQAGCSEGWAYLGSAALARNDSATAAKHYEMALQEEPRVVAFSPRADVLHNLGVSYTNLGRFDLARERLREALDAAGDESSTAGAILYQWALSHVAQENCGEATPLLKQARSKRLGSALAFDTDLLLGFCAARSGNDRELLGNVQVGLRQLDLRQLSPSRQGLAEVILRAPN